MKQDGYCVYIHTNKINNKVYIGITSQKPERRWRNGTNYYGNSYFNRAIKKYGWNEGFEHKILFENLSKKEAEEIEIRLIKEYDSTNRSKGYNIENGGNAKGKHSKETIRKISESQKGKKNYMYGKTGNKNTQSKKVVCLNNKTIFDSLVEAKKITGIDSGGISKCCNHKKSYAGKDKNNNRLFWMWHKDFLLLTEKEIENILKEKIQQELDQTTIKQKKIRKRDDNITFYKSIVCLNDGLFYETCIEASKKYNVSSSAISSNINKNTLYCNSKNKQNTYVFCLKEEYDGLTEEHISEMIDFANKKSSRKGEFSSRSKKVICLEDGKIFVSAKECAEYYGIEKSQVCMVCKGTVKSAKKLHFKYI